MNCFSVTEGSFFLPTRMVLLRLGPFPTLEEIKFPVGSNFFKAARYVFIFPFTYPCLPLTCAPTLSPIFFPLQVYNIICFECKEFIEGFGGERDLGYGFSLQNVFFLQYFGLSSVIPFCTFFGSYSCSAVFNV